MSTNYAAMLMFLLGALVVSTSAVCRIPSKSVKVDENSYIGNWYQHGRPENIPVRCLCNDYYFLNDHILVGDSCYDDRLPSYFSIVTDPNDLSVKKDPNGKDAINIYVLDVVYDKYTIEYGCINGHSVAVISTRDKDYQVPQADIDKALTKNGITQVITIVYGYCP